MMLTDFDNYFTIGNRNEFLQNTYNIFRRLLNKKLIRRWDSEHELSLRRHRTRTTKYNRLVYKFRHRWTRLRVGTQVYQIQWNNATVGLIPVVLKKIHVLNVGSYTDHLHFPSSSAVVHVDACRWWRKMQMIGVASYIENVKNTVLHNHRFLFKACWTNHTNSIVSLIRDVYRPTPLS